MKRLLGCGAITMFLVATQFSCGEDAKSPNSPTVDTTPPTVTNTSPQTSATNVATNSSIVATFSENMNPATFTNSSISLTGGISGTVSYTNREATLAPATLLSANTQYTVTISNSVEDEAGNAMAAPHTWSFTTADNPAVPCDIVFNRRDASGAWNVTRVSCDGSGLAQLTNTGSVDWPRWSQDGQKLIYSLNQSGCYELWTMDADGSNKFQVYAGTSPCLAYGNHEWAPDGTKIAVHATGATESMHVINTNGTGLTLLSDSAEMALWKGDGSKLAIVKSGRIVISNPDGSGQQNVFSPGNHRYVKSVIGWKGLSDSVLFVSRDSLGSGDSLVTIRLNGSGYKGWAACQFANDDVAITTSGSRVVYVRSGVLYTLSFATGAEQVIPVSLPTFRDIAISEDESWVAVRNSANNDADIVLFHFDGSGQVNITNSPAFKEVGPCFRPGQ